MGVMQLSAITKAAGWESILCLAGDDILSVVEKQRPDIVSVSMMSTDYHRLIPIIESIKEKHPQIPILVGGAHPTFSPDLIENPAVDAICIGEGDHAFADVLSRLEQGRSLDGIGNIITKSSATPIRPLIEDLDELPFLDREIVYNRSPSMKVFKLRSFFTSRGCPYHCTYCFNHSYNAMYKGLGKIVRKRSVEHILAEIEEVTRKYPTEYIRFSDDAFVHRVDDWLVEFAHKYPKRIGLPFYCLIRPNCVSKEMVQLIKESGCRSVCMSIETADTELRSNVLKRNMTTDQITGAFDLFNEAGLKIYTNSILGLPTSTYENEIETIDLNIRCRPAFANFTIFVPFPGTEIYNFCVKENLLNDETKIELASHSTGERSILDAFSKKEKRKQKNLSLLGPYAVEFPFLRNIILKFLVKFPENWIFVILHFVIKNLLFRKRIVPVKLSLKDYMVLGFSQLGAEIRNIGAKHKTS